jgi:hypothetical protein
MTVRVAHVGTGNVGRLALTELVTNPQFELTGLSVSSAEKVGKGRRGPSLRRRIHRHPGRQ